jgi:hypothetical protein
LFIYSPYVIKSNSQKFPDKEVVVAFAQSKDFLSLSQW